MTCFFRSLQNLMPPLRPFFYVVRNTICSLTRYVFPNTNFRHHRRNFGPGQLGPRSHGDINEKNIFDDLIRISGFSSKDETESTRSFEHEPYLWIFYDISDNMGRKFVLWERTDNKTCKIGRWKFSTADNIALSKIKS